MPNKIKGSRVQGCAERIYPPIVFVGIPAYSLDKSRLGPKRETMRPCKHDASATCTKWDPERGGWTVCISHIHRLHAATCCPLCSILRDNAGYTRLMFPSLKGSNVSTTRAERLLCQDAARMRQGLGSGIAAVLSQRGSACSSGLDQQVSFIDR